jgi:uncharacterized membrane protein YeaQ/YmgE (transglycosylase-associated protein family)
MFGREMMGNCPKHGSLDGALSMEDGTMLLNLLLWCLFGLIAGAIAQFLMPGRDPGEHATATGFVTTTVLGVVGALLGGFVGSKLFNWDVTGFNFSSFVVAICGALIVLVIYRIVTAAGARRAH